MYTLKSSQFRFKNYLHEILGRKSSHVSSSSEGEEGSWGLVLGTSRMRDRFGKHGGRGGSEPQWREVTEVRKVM